MVHNSQDIIGKTYFIHTRTLSAKEKCGLCFKWTSEYTKQAHLIRMQGTNSVYHIPSLISLMLWHSNHNIVQHTLHIYRLSLYLHQKGCSYWSHILWNYSLTHSLRLHPENNYTYLGHTNIYLISLKYAAQFLFYFPQTVMYFIISSCFVHTAFTSTYRMC